MATTKILLERSPFYAFLGAADVAMETVRSGFETASDSAASLRDDFTPEQVQERILETVNDVREQLVALPAFATEQYGTVAANVQRAYEEFAASYLEFAARGVELTREAGDNTFAAVLEARKDLAKGVERLAGLAGRRADVVEAEAEHVVRSTAAKQGAAKRPTRKAVAQQAAKPAAKKTPATKPAAKKAATAKPAAKKAPAKKTVAKKAPAKKTVAKKTPARKAVATPATTAPVATPAQSAAPALPVETTTDGNA
ncbi:histone H1-like repetitive region-containing protein [Flexivirga caeni]|uniref:histone H1-like repetitive region-containing protein n=1 Tax=Flexivirga caeni TaxID=2294115 RepID=UPI0013155C94|nr:histone H1-like repetitive region-containing protein [Flexivirga caeni]